MDKILGRSDDMMIIGGVNVFPSQIEAVIMEFAEAEPHYQIRVFKKGYLDAMKVELEAKPDFYGGGKDALLDLAKRISARIHGVVGISVPVEILPLAAIARSEGKAKRVFDERNK
jgi:phenylacetate-CoA ligase